MEAVQAPQDDLAIVFHEAPLTRTDSDATVRSLLGSVASCQYSLGLRMANVAANVPLLGGKSGSPVRGTQSGSGPPCKYHPPEEGVPLGGPLRT